MAPRRPSSAFRISNYDPQALVPLLKSQLPYSIPLLRRLQHDLAYPSPTAKILTTFTGAETPASPWLAAYVDLFAGRETQIVIYSSLEADATSPVIDGEFVSALHAPREFLDQARAQLLALLSHVKTHLLPDYLSSTQAATGSTPTTSSLGQDPVSKHSGLVPPPPPGAFLIGNLHTGLFSMLKTTGEYTHAEPVPGLRIHRFDNPPYIKYLFRAPSFATGSPDSPDGAPAPLLDVIRFTDKKGRIGVLPHQYDLIRLRTNVPRSRETLTKLPGVAMYADSKIELQAHPSDNSNAAEGSGNQPPVGEMPIAWAFLGIDGGLATLHVEPEYRGQNLALHVSKEAMRRGMAKGGIWRDRDEEGETWVHTNVLASNVASRRVMEKLGGEIGWTCTWTVVEYGV